MTKKNPRLDVSRYRGQWLALDPRTHKIASHHRSFRLAKKAAQKNSVSRPVLYAVPKSDAYFVGHGGICSSPTGKNFGTAGYVYCL